MAAITEDDFKNKGIQALYDAFGQPMNKNKDMDWFYTKANQSNQSPKYPVVKNMGKNNPVDKEVGNLYEDWIGYEHLDNITYEFKICTINSSGKLVEYVFDAVNNSNVINIPYSNSGMIQLIYVLSNKIKGNDVERVGFKVNSMKSVQGRSIPISENWFNGFNVSTVANGGHYSPSGSTQDYFVRNVYCTTKTPVPDALILDIVQLESDKHLTLSIKFDAHQYGWLFDITYLWEYYLAAVAAAKEAKNVDTTTYRPVIVSHFGGLSYKDPDVGQYFYMYNVRDVNLGVFLPRKRYFGGSVTMIDYDHRSDVGKNPFINMAKMYEQYNFLDVYNFRKNSVQSKPTEKPTNVEITNNAYYNNGITIFIKESILCFANRNSTKGLYLTGNSTDKDYKSITVKIPIMGNVTTIMDPNFYYAKSWDDAAWVKDKDNDYPITYHYTEPCLKTIGWRASILPL
jgi:hypothetical protein